MKMSMESRTRAGMNVGAGLSLTTAAGFMVLASAGSATAAASCPAGSSEVSPGVCSTTMTSSGSFAVPAGVTTLEAILIGGAGAGQANICESYSGGEAGEVTYVTAISTTGPVSVVIGGGGVAPEIDCNALPDPAASGALTSISDAASIVSQALGGGYANGSEDPGGLPSAGVALLSGTVALWPAYGGEPCIAADGQDGVIASGDTTDGAFFGATTANLPCGGGATGDTLPGDPGGGDVFSSGMAGTGSGGAAYSYYFDTVNSQTYESDPGNGGSGAVIFRFFKAEVTELVIADTGPANAALGWASAALIGVGAVLLAGARRVRRTAV